MGRSLDLSLQHLLLLLVVHCLVDVDLVLQVSYSALDLVEAPLGGGHALLKLSLERCLLCGLLCDVSEPVFGGQQGSLHLNDVSSSILAIRGQLFQGILNVAHDGALADSLTKLLISLIFTILQGHHELSLLVAEGLTLPSQLKVHISGVIRHASVLVCGTSAHSTGHLTEAESLL